MMLHLTSCKKICYDSLQRLESKTYTHLHRKKDLKPKIQKDYNMFLQHTKGGHQLVKKFTLS